MRGLSPIKTAESLMHGDEPNKLYVFVGLDVHKTAVSLAVTEGRRGKAGERVKSDQRDALMLAKLHRAGELTAVWAPDAAH
jgi:hypothetical protein